MSNAVITPEAALGFVRLGLSHAGQEHVQDALRVMPPDQLAAMVVTSVQQTQRQAASRDNLHEELDRAREELAAVARDEDYPFLSPGEVERLAYFMEECGEAVAAAGKVLRHGYDGRDPTDPDCPGNQVLLEREVSDVVAAVARMTTALDLSAERVDEGSAAKVQRTEYFHHQPARVVRLDR